MVRQIAIDGPAGAGKSTVSRRVAKELNMMYLDTGAMYRAVAYEVLQERIDPRDEKAVADVVRRIQIRFVYAADGERIFSGKEDVTEAIRMPEVSRIVAIVAVCASVRERLVLLQRQIAEEEAVVMDGRDIGTYVLPQADLKVYMTATPAERARRRCLELEKKGQVVSYQQVLLEMNSRDEMDAQREISPLRMAEDAWLLDTDDLSIDEVVDLIVQRARAK